MIDRKCGHEVSRQCIIGGRFLAISREKSHNTEKAKPCRAVSRGDVSQTTVAYEYCERPSGIIGGVDSLEDC